MSNSRYIDIFSNNDDDLKFDRNDDITADIRIEFRDFVYTIGIYDDDDKKITNRLRDCYYKIHQLLSFNSIVDDFNITYSLTDMNNDSYDVDSLNKLLVDIIKNKDKVLKDYRIHMSMDIHIVFDETDNMDVTFKKYYHMISIIYKTLINKEYLIDNYIINGLYFEGTDEKNGYHRHDTNTIE